MAQAQREGETLPEGEEVMKGSHSGVRRRQQVQPDAECQRIRAKQTLGLRVSDRRSTDLGLHYGAKNSNVDIPALAGAQVPRPTSLALFDPGTSPSGNVSAAIFNPLMRPQVN